MTPNAAPLCPYCQTRPVPRGVSGRPRRDCGARACRIVRRRQVEAQRRARYRPTRPCAVCGVPVEGRSVTCSTACRQAHRRETWRASQQRRQRGHAGPVVLRYTPESPDAIDAAFAAARAARIARERATGRRTYGVDVTWASSLTRETAGGRL